MSDKLTNKNKHVPPVVGEFGYYDSRLVDKEPHWLMKTNDSETFDCGVHYSLPILMSDQQFITCHGPIKELGKKIDHTNRIKSSFCEI